MAAIGADARTKMEKLFVFAYKIRKMKYRKDEIYEKRKTNHYGTD